MGFVSTSPVGGGNFRLRLGTRYSTLSCPLVPTSTASLGTREVFLPFSDRISKLLKIFHVKGISHTTLWRGWNNCILRHHASREGNVNLLLLMIFLVDINTYTPVHLSIYLFPSIPN